MCGIFGIISESRISFKDFKVLALHAQQRGKDSSGLILAGTDRYQLYRSDSNIRSLLQVARPTNPLASFGHSRLITNGFSDNQPIARDGVYVLHNGIIVNDSEVWEKLETSREQETDSEVIAAIAIDYISETSSLVGLSERVLSLCDGVISTAVIVPRIGKMILFSNNGSLYLGTKNGATYFSSEEYPLQKLGCLEVKKLRNEEAVFDIPKSDNLDTTEQKTDRSNLIPSPAFTKSESKLLKYEPHSLKRCTKCILPETMPFIKFDNDGVCNYCTNYKIRNNPRPKEELYELVKPYRRTTGMECIVPFSGGRDSCFALHLIVKELKLKPITYTYDWGMVTDLGRRNISRMCSALGVENIIIAADIAKKRRNIRMNLKAWLKAPHLGMMAMLTAGDKHFFRHVETIKKQTGIQLNLWGVNPLEVTHFKSGFLNIPPDFEEDKVYSNGILKQIRYQNHRVKAMFESPGYFNRSIWDTLSGEYYRSFTKKNDYFHIFDYWQWDEVTINKTLLDDYDWETACDTKTTWRIGDGTAALYNYIYYSVAGFTEHDTFRSNQIREGQISREMALRLIQEENQPRYQSIRWYLDTLDLDFEEVIGVINNIPKIIPSEHDK